MKKIIVSLISLVLVCSIMLTPRASVYAFDCDYWFNEVQANVRMAINYDQVGDTANAQIYWMAARDAMTMWKNLGCDMQFQ